MPVEERMIGTELPASFRNQYTAAVAEGGEGISPRAGSVEG